jgi:pyrroline-5-carboxylate reductase
LKNLSIIGGGNLGKAIALGIEKSETKIFDQIFISRRRVHLIESLVSETILVSKSNTEHLSESKVIIIAVKPHQIDDILDEISSFITPKHLVISVVTGVSIDKIQRKIKAQVYRAMPNTAIEIQESITCIAGKSENEASNLLVKDIFETSGKVMQINEELMGAATVLGACGIAFALRFLRAATQGGIEIGFSSETSQQIAAQTLKGAAELILKNGSHPEQEIDKVTTPMGVTISGLNEMEHQGFSSALIKGLLTSYNKMNQTLSE